MIFEPKYESEERSKQRVGALTEMLQKSQASSELTDKQYLKKCMDEMESINPDSIAELDRKLRLRNANK